MFKDYFSYIEGASAPFNSFVEDFLSNLQIAPVETTVSGEKGGMNPASMTIKYPLGEIGRVVHSTGDLLLSNHLRYRLGAFINAFNAMGKITVFFGRHRSRSDCTERAV